MDIILNLPLKNLYEKNFSCLQDVFNHIYKPNPYSSQAQLYNELLGTNDTPYPIQTLTEMGKPISVSVELSEQENRILDAWKGYFKCAKKRCVMLILAYYFLDWIHYPDFAKQFSEEDFPFPVDPDMLKKLLEATVENESQSSQDEVE